MIVYVTYLSRINHNTMEYANVRLLKNVKTFTKIYILIEDKAIPVTGSVGLEGCETLRLPHFLNDRLRIGRNVASHTLRSPFTPGRFLVYI
jgi:hypothetical protein